MSEHSTPESSPPIVELDVSGELQDGSLVFDAYSLLYALEQHKGKKVSIGHGNLRAAQPVIEFADGICTLDPNERKVTVAETIAHIKGKEYAILELLALNADEDISREEIVRQVWDKPPNDYHGHNSAITTITRLRKSLDDLHSGLGHKSRGVILTDQRESIARYRLLTHWKDADLSTEDR